MKIFEHISSVGCAKWGVCLLTSHRIDRPNAGTSLRTLTTALFVVVCIAPRTSAGISGFHETFSGDGAYSSFNGSLLGFDNPDWTVWLRPRDGQLVTELTPIGFHLEANAGNVVDERASRIDLGRAVEGFGSFAETVTIRGLDLAELPSSPAPTQFNVVTLGHHLPSDPVAEFGFSIGEQPKGELQDGYWSLFLRSGDHTQSVPLPRASNLTLTLEFDNVARQTTFTYDDLDDG